MEPAGGAFAVTIFYPTIDRSVVTRGRRARMGGFEIANAPGRPRMTIQARLLCAIAVSGFIALAATSPARALTTQECSAKYQAAKTAGTLNGQKWNDFRKAECGADATAAPAATPAAAPAAPAAPKAVEAQPKDPDPPAAAARGGAPVFPSPPHPL